MADVTADRLEVDTAQESLLFNAHAVYVPNLIEWDPTRSMLPRDSVKHKNKPLHRRAIVISGEKW